VVRKKIRTERILGEAWEMLIGNPVLFVPYLLVFPLYIPIILIWVALMPIPPTPEDLYALTLAEIGWLIVLIPISMAILLMAMATIIVKVDALKRRKRVSLRSALGMGLERTPRLFVAAVLILALVLLGLTLFIIPGVYLGVRLLLAAPACVLRRKGFGIKESWRLTKGRFWNLFGLMVVLGVISIAISLIPLIGPLINWFVMAPFSLTIYTLAYLKLRK
jgi:hypothetical protein